MDPMQVMVAPGRFLSLLAAVRNGPLEDVVVASQLLPEEGVKVHDELLSWPVLLTFGMFESSPEGAPTFAATPPFSAVTSKS